MYTCITYVYVYLSFYRSVLVLLKKIRKIDEKAFSIYKYFVFSTYISFFFLLFQFYLYDLFGLLFLFLFLFADILDKSIVVL